MKIIIVEKSYKTFDIAAPMAEKDMCYEVLREAKRCIQRQGPQHFDPRQRRIQVTMDDATGHVTVSAPLPPIEKCELMFVAACRAIERSEGVAPLFH